VANWASTAKYVATDMTGTGAKKTGGLWNPVGLAANYSSKSIALAVHGTVVHLRSGGLPLTRYLVRIDVQDDVWTRVKRSRRQLAMKDSRI
jgi:RES domain-containing protein